ncbi:hypothetical protein [Spiroplasma ixodetis]|uniref:Uncharacterized protein n=1 Tax=Spiroplasma ixodetis TaxID=2141 RepID=A0ABM8JR97_9MOLU
MTNILLTFKLGEKAVGKKINPKIKTLKSDLESEVYEYIDNTLKSPLIIDRDDLFTFNHFLINRHIP